MNSQDAYPNEPKVKDMPKTFLNLPKIILLVILRAYQKFISPAVPPDTCRFYPSCSHYAYQSIYKYGVFKGVALAVWRLVRCNPFNPGGYDPVP